MEIIKRSAFAILALVCVASAWAADFAPLLEFSVTDAQEEFTASLGRDVVLKIRKAVDSQGRHMGWDVMAVDRRLGDWPNFFYDCLCGHGPRPHHLYAWHFAENYYPGTDRMLPVYGYPIEVRVRCVDCQTAGSGAEAHFTGGTVEVSWRRLPESNPRQKKIP